MSFALFQDRYEAGRFLASRLGHLASDPDVVVLALPRGGVPVGFEVARALNVPMDVFVVRKLGVPGREELAMGAIASGGARVLNRDVLQTLDVPERVIDIVTEKEQRELERQEREYRDGRPPAAVAGRKVVLVDDGLATGSSMRVAVAALRQKNPTRIVIAVPVAAAAACANFETEVDQVICGITPDPFWAVGQWYRDFSPISDEEVRDLLRQAASVPGSKAA
jgi:predicted phosphoribosyltransferase